MPIRKIERTKYRVFQSEDSNVKISSTDVKAILNIKMDDTINFVDLGNESSEMIRAEELTIN
jgi:hypothetical protein